MQRHDAFLSGLFNRQTDLVGWLAIHSSPNDRYIGFGIWPAMGPVLYTWYLNMPCG